MVVSYSLAPVSYITPCLVEPSFNLSFKLASVIRPPKIGSNIPLLRSLQVSVQSSISAKAISYFAFPDDESELLYITLFKLLGSLLTMSGFKNLLTNAEE